MDRAMGFPFRVTELGAAAISSRRQAVEEQLEQLLMTIPGERVNRPGFGCGIQRLVFGGTDALSLAAAEYVVSTSIRQQLRDLVVLDAVRVTAVESTILVDILYTLREGLEEAAFSISVPLEVSP